MRTLLAAAAALTSVVLLAPPASAGCTTDYLIRAEPPRRYVEVSITGPAVYVHDEAIVAELNQEIGYTTTFVNCVV